MFHLSVSLTRLNYSSRRPTATSPAGSPMPPSSHTPGPPSVGSNSSNPGSAFSIAPSASSGHHLTSSSSSVPSAASSLQQLEQMVMPHLGPNSNNSNSSTTPSTKATTGSTNSSSSSFYPVNANSSPMSPQAQTQSKLYQPQYGSSPSTQQPTSQYPPYHTPYGQSQPGTPIGWQSPAGQISNSNTHSMKSSNSMLPQSSPASTHLTGGSSKSSEPSLHTPYASSAYGNSSKSPSGAPSDSGEYSQSFNSSQSYPGSTYDSMSNQKQSSSKNDSHSYDRSKNSMDMNSSSGQQSQLTSLNSNSYHSMMQQPYPGYPGQSRFDPMSSQYNMSSDSSGYPGSNDQSSSMMYDPYNIDNSLAMPPHQTMSEYRESQANMSSGNNDFSQNDPYAANFDDYETTSKRKGKGRPKKDTSAMPVIKKERKPRAPRAPSTRGSGRGRGRGRSSMTGHLHMPGMMSDYGDSGLYAPPIMPPMSNESMDMYNSNVDMYSSPQMVPNKLMSPNHMMPGNPPSSSSMMPRPSDMLSPFAAPCPSSPPVNDSMSTSQPNIPSYDPMRNANVPIADNGYSSSYLSDQVSNSERPLASSLSCDKETPIVDDVKMPSYGDLYPSEPPPIPVMTKSINSDISPVCVPPAISAPVVNESIESISSDDKSQDTMSNSYSMAQMDSQAPVPIPQNELKSSGDGMTNSSIYEPYCPPVPAMQPVSEAPVNSDYSNSYNSYGEQEQNVSQAGFATSTPAIEKEKKQRRRKSKKQAEESIDEIVEPIEQFEAIPDEQQKKKRSRNRKPKSIDDSVIAQDSSTLDYGEQSSSNFDMSGTLTESELPVKTKPKRIRSRAKPVELKEHIINEPLSADVTDFETEAPEESIVEDVPKKPRIKNKTPKKRLPKLALKLKQNKKRRRGFGSPDNTDIEKTPPPSPTEEDELNKRRSSRNTKRTRYNDEMDIDLSDDEFLQKKDEGNVQNVQLSEDTMVVEKIMANRMGKRELEFEPGDIIPDNGNKDEPHYIDVEEFYVKYKNLSYLHCDWKTEEELESGDKRVGQKIKRYRQKKDINVFDFLDDEPFNPDYVEVDRVLDINEVEEMIEEVDDSEPDVKKSQSDETSTDQTETKEELENKNDSEEPNKNSENGTKDESTVVKTNEDVDSKPKRWVKKKTRHFLVKWRGLSYEESTWEREDEIDPVKIEQFFKFRNPPPRSEWKIKKRPKGSEWIPIKDSPIYKNGNTLRAYQLEGLNWLNFCWHNE